MKKRWLSLLLASALVLGTSACGMPSATSEASSEAPASSAPAASSAASSEAPSQAPAEDYTLRVVDWSDSIMDIREEFHKEYMENNKNITIEYTMLTVDQFKNTILTMIKSGDGPDLFPVPNGITLSTALKEDWFQPMSPLLTDEFIATLDPACLVEGVATMNGDIYTIPERAAQTTTCIFYNQDVLDAAGVTQLPKTYDELIAACKQVTEAGKGSFYGLIEGGKQLNRLESLARSFTGMAGGKIALPNKVLTVDGRAPYDSPELLGVYELFHTLAANGSIHPDTVNLSAPEAREMFAQGQAAFLMQGMWCISPWKNSYPDMNYGVMPIPTPDGTQKGAVQRDEYLPWIGIYKQSSNPQAAADYMMALFGQEYNVFGKAVAAGERISVVPAINEANMSNEILKQYVDVAESMIKTVPSATARDEKVYDFYTEVKDIQPNLSAILQGVMAGSISDYKKELETFGELSTEEWKRASEAVGLDFSAFEFPNWDVTKDYTESDYSALK